MNLMIALKLDKCLLCGILNKEIVQHVCLVSRVTQLITFRMLALSNP